MRSDVFNEGQNAVINRLIGAFPPVVATFEAVPEEVVGWACREFARPYSHFIYVKHDYRRLGIASTLAAGTLQHSHQTRAGEKLAVKLGSVFNPFLLFGVNT